MAPKLVPHKGSGTLKRSLLSTGGWHFSLVSLGELSAGLFNEHGFIYHVLKIGIVVANNLNFKAGVETSLKTLLTGLIGGKVEMKKNEFRDLKQGNMSVSEYLTKFTQLSRYAREDVATDEARNSFFFISTFPSGT